MVKEGEDYIHEKETAEKLYRLIIAMKSMNAADITTQHDNLFKVWYCVFPESVSGKWRLSKCHTEAHASCVTLLWIFNLCFSLDHFSSVFPLMIGA